MILVLQIIGGFVFGSILALVVLSWRSWKAASGEDVTEIARAICKAAYGKDLPKGWGAVVIDAGDKQTPLEESLGYGAMVLGAASRDIKLIEIFRDRLAKNNSCALETMIHECLHALQPDRMHNNDRSYREFDLLVKSGVYNFWRNAEKD